MIGLVIGLVGLVGVYAVLVLVGGIAADTEFLLFELILLIFLGASTLNAYIASWPTELVVRLGVDGIEGAAGRYSQIVPWSGVERLWIVRGGSVCPVLCIAADDLSRFHQKGFRWRLKAYANRRLFGTSLATPLQNTD
ncbi:MAG: hypothetical protein GEV03_04400 [Streptosporangiales bacterium]|nr:hypothetical protein [Streptosporangiales bacterium]